jgi:hypothetical protein
MSNPPEAQPAMRGKTGEKFLRVPGILLISLYQLLIVTAAIYTLVCLWNGASAVMAPTIPAPNGASSSAVAVFFIAWTFNLPLEVLLLLVVVCCGVLGSSLHSLRSLTWYVGSRALRRSWILRYVMQPLTGASLSLIVYFVVRAGFLPAAVSSTGPNYVGFAAIAGLVGLFSDAAVLKLKSVAEEIFTKPKPGDDSVAEGTPSQPAAQDGKK